MRVRNRIFSGSVTLLISAAALLYLGIASPLCAQSANSGTVAGIITDPSGAVVSGVTVTLTDTSTNTSRTSNTNDAGRYIFVDVSPGVYDLSATKSGFSVVKTRTTVKVGVATTANMSLQVGGSNVVVEVTAVGNELQTMNATVGNTITGIALDALPTTGPRREHFPHAAAGHQSRRQRGRRRSRPELLLAGWRQQHQRHGRQHERVHHLICRRSDGWNCESECWRGCRRRQA